MTFAWQISIIDGLIKESPDATIRDYIACLAEIELITPPKEEDMNVPKHYTPEQAMFIIKHHREYSAVAIADYLGLDEAVVRNFGSRHRLEFAKAVYRRTEEPRVAKVVHQEKRPDASYSNSGFIQVTQKYAI